MNIRSCGRLFPQRRPMPNVRKVSCSHLHLLSRLIDRVFKAHLCSRPLPLQEERFRNSVGARVDVKDYGQGTLSFYGYVDFAKNTKLCGVTLDDPLVSNSDSTISQCPPCSSSLSFLSLFLVRSFFLYICAYARMHVSCICVPLLFLRIFPTASCRGFRYCQSTTTSSHST